MIIVYIILGLAAVFGIGAFSFIKSWSFIRVGSIFRVYDFFSDSFAPSLPHTGDFLFFGFHMHTDISLTKLSIR